ncbi:MAG: hypothetical protein OXG88_02930 [Gammaproteobacteria bacterium]|nr:hypothetical protein [Gammaproteobacteria bacterium]
MFLSATRHYWLLSTFRGSPANSNGSTETILVLYTILFVLGIGATYWLLTSGFLVVFAGGFVITQTLIMIGILSVLRIRYQQSRFRKTLSSYLGASVVITISSIAVTAVTGGNNLIESLIYCWNVAVLGYIFHKSIEVKFWFGLLIALVLYFVVEIVGGLVLHLLFYESLLSLITEQSIKPN